MNDSTTKAPPSLPHEVGRGEYKGNPHNRNDGAGLPRLYAVTEDPDGWRLAWEWDARDQKWREREYEDAATVFLAWALDLAKRLGAEREACADEIRLLKEQEPAGSPKRDALAVAVLTITSRK